MRDRVLRPILTALLMLGFLLTGHAGVQARGAAPAEGQMVLCIGSRLVLVHIDAQGKPTSPPHLCPDCVAVAVAFVPPHLSERGTMPCATCLSWPVLTHRGAGLAAAPFQARDPPGGVLNQQIRHTT